MTLYFNFIRLYIFQHWQIPLGRQFRSIKLWFLLRMIGLEGLRHHIRQGIERAKYFEKLMRSDPRFQILFPVTLGLICFQLKSPNKSQQVSLIKQTEHFNEILLCFQFNLRINPYLSGLNKVNKLFYWYMPEPSKKLTLFLNGKLLLPKNF